MLISNVDGRIRQEKTDVLPKEILQILQKYTTWETMEDLNTTLDRVFYGSDGDSCNRDIKDLESELGPMKKLSSDLDSYRRDTIDKSHQSSRKAVWNTIHQIIDKFPGIQNMEEYNQLFTEDDKRCIETILRERTEKKDTERQVEIAADDAGICTLKEWHQKLMIAGNKSCESSNLRSTMIEVWRKVNTIIVNLESDIRVIRSRMAHLESYREKKRQIREWKEKVDLAKRLKSEKFQCLSKVMKQVLGDRVENVVPSFGYSSPCLLKDSGMGGKTMEINSEDTVIIEDLRKKYEADKNDIHVRNATLVLFNYAELYHNTKQEQQNDQLEREENYEDQS